MGTRRVVAMVPQYSHEATRVFVNKGLLLSWNIDVFKYNNIEHYGFLNFCTFVKANNVKNKNNHYLVKNKTLCAAHPIHKPLKKGEKKQITFSNVPCRIIQNALFSSR